MLKKLLFWAAIVSLFSPIWGCSVFSQRSQVGKSGDTNGDTTAINRSSIKGGSFSIRLEEYLGALSKGDSGEKFWCQATADLAKTPLSVRSTKVIKEEDAKYTEDWGVVQGKLYIVQIASATKNGSPIEKNWLLSLSAEKDGNPCVRTLNEQ